MSDESHMMVQKILSQELDLSTLNNQKAFVNQLADKINQLIQKDFASLMNILYRIDVDESRLKKTLHEQPDKDAGYLIAKLIIDRQLQKMEAKKHFGNDMEIGDDDKW